MIGKRIRRSAIRRAISLAEVSAVVEALTAYAVNADPELVQQLLEHSREAAYALDAVATSQFEIEPGEKVEFHGSRNLLGASLLGHQRQMVAACMLAPAVKMPVEHYVLSFKEGEEPTREQVAEMVGIFATEMGYASSPLKWAVHTNTRNHHLHIVVIKIDLVKACGVTPGDGWDIDRLHQVLALIEEKQGWAREPNALYTARAGAVYGIASGNLVRRADGSRDGLYKRRSDSPELGSYDAYKPIVDVLKSARSWRELHDGLAAFDAVYFVHASGARICVGAEGMRASDFGRQFSHGRMCKILGDFEEDLFVTRDPYEDYKNLQREQRRLINQALKQTIIDLDERRQRALKKVQAKTLAARIIAEEQVELEFDLVVRAVRQAYDRERRKIAEKHLTRERWFKAGRPEPVPIQLPCMIFADRSATSLEIGERFGFSAKFHESSVEYLDRQGRAFSDYGVLLIVHDISASAVEAALVLASSRLLSGSRLTIKGPDHFLSLCREIAAKHSIAVQIGDEAPHEKRNSDHAPDLISNRADRANKRNANASLLHNQAVSPAISTSSELEPLMAEKAIETSPELISRREEGVS